MSAYQAERLLEFFMKNLGPPVYNQAISDARAFMLENAGLPVDCHVVAQGRLGNGVLVSLASADGTLKGSGGTVAVFGDEGRLVVEGSEARICADGDPQMLEVDLEDANPAAEFVSGLTGGEMHLATGREGADAVAFTEAVYISAAEGRAVSIEG